MYRAVAFDLDDTLVDRHGFMRRYFRMLLEEYGEKQAGVEENLVTIMEWDNGGHSNRNEVNRRVAEMFGVRLTAERMQELLYQNAARLIKAMPYALDTLRALQGQYQISLITNGSSILQHEKIRGARLAPFLDDVIVSEDVGLRKPMTEIYALCCKRLNLLPQEVLYIGDNVLLDYEGPRNAGMGAILYGNPVPEQDLYAIQDFRRLPFFLAAVAK